MAILNPSPGWPSTFSGGTRTSLKYSSAWLLPRAPILRSAGPRSNPGMSGRRMNAVTRSTVSPLRSTAVCANATMISLNEPLPIQILLPFRTHDPSSCRTARDWMPAASLPAWGSVSANEAIHSPVAALGRYRAFCASVPASWIPLIPMERCTPSMIPSPASKPVTYSNTRQYALCDSPIPPCSWAMEMPNSPIRFSSSMASSGMRSFSSIHSRSRLASQYARSRWTKSVTSRSSSSLMRG